MKQPFLIHYNDNGNVKTYEFQIINLNLLIEFVVNSQSDIIEKTNCENEDILLFIPQYLIEFLNYERPKRSEISTHITITNMFFCGVQVHPSFENKAIVFYNALITEKTLKYELNL